MKLARDLESNWMVTPTRKLSDFTLPLTLESKISIFHERIVGWYLNIAEKNINRSIEFSAALSSTSATWVLC